MDTGSETTLQPGGRVATAVTELCGAAFDGSGPAESLAADSGYYDQAHMITDFRRRSGRTPTALRPHLG